LKPPGEAKAAAWPRTMGSVDACSAKTEERRGRNCGLDVKFCGVGGNEVTVPIASCGVGGVVGSSDRRDLVGSMGS
jgi:hypothetical protein